MKTLYKLLFLIITSFILLTTVTCTREWDNPYDQNNTLGNGISGDTPIAAFTSDKTEITESENITFTDQSTNNPTSWSWSFGEGATSTVQNPLHTYNTAGTYTVVLTVTNAYGNDTETKTNYITVNSENTTTVVDVTNPTTGKTWMDRNLGASQAATSSTDENAYGDLYQWGRTTDGHEKRNSATTTTLSNSDSPGHGNFIIVESEPYDWRNPQNNKLWQGVTGINNPCPSGYRIPTEAEWYSEYQSWSNNYAAGAIASPLKLPLAGRRYNGSLDKVHYYGEYWSSTLNGTNSSILFFASANAIIYDRTRAMGLSIRCIKDSGTTGSAPVAAFTANKTSVIEGEGIVFSDQSTNTPTSWSWNFGDGGTSSQQNPSYAYNTAGIYTVTLTVTNAYGNDTETKTNYITVNSNNAVTDYDGNTYPTVTIGTQTWMAENLKVTHYPNGTEILLVTDSLTWANLEDNNTDVAYCIYNNNTSNEMDTYGALYTYAAAKDACPMGWHLPTDTEWTTLENYISNDGHNGTEGSALKATNGWYEDGNGIDIYGFTALPGGYRNSIGAFNNTVGYYSFWWSSTENNNSLANLRYLRYSDGDVYHNDYYKSSGLSVRCIKD